MFNNNIFPQIVSYWFWDCFHCNKQYKKKTQKTPKINNTPYKEYFIS